jgi:hypothetical protein
VNPLYSILESPQRWLIFAGLSFLAALLGTMMMLAYAWPHWLARTWLYLGLAATVYFLVLALLEWRDHLPEPQDSAPAPPESTGDSTA